MQNKDFGDTVHARGQVVRAHAVHEVAGPHYKPNMKPVYMHVCTRRLVSMGMAIQHFYYTGFACHADNSEASRPQERMLTLKSLKDLYKDTYSVFIQEAAPINCSDTPVLELGISWL